MTIENLFEKEGYDKTISRIQKLNVESKAQWGKMTVSQMLAHCNVAFEFTYHPENFTKPGFLKKFLLKSFVKPAVVGPKPYPKNGRTAPEFVITGDRDFEEEKTRLLGFLKKTSELGLHHFDGKEYINFGKMSSQEWNTLFSKHLDHHLNQFGV